MIKTRLGQMFQLLRLDRGAEPELPHSAEFGSGHGKNQSTNCCDGETYDRDDIKWLPAIAEDWLEPGYIKIVVVAPEKKQTDFQRVERGRAFVFVCVVVYMWVHF